MQSPITDGCLMHSTEDNCNTYILGMCVKGDTSILMVGCAVGKAVRKILPFVPINCLAFD